MTARRTHHARTRNRNTPAAARRHKGGRGRSKTNSGPHGLEWHGNPQEGYLSHMPYRGGGVFPDSYMIFPLPGGKFWIDVTFDDDPYRTSRGGRRRFVVLSDGHLALKSNRSLSNRAEFQSLDAAKRWVNEHVTWRANHPGPAPEAIAAEPPPESWWERLLWG